MCLRYMNIKPALYSGPRAQFVPCGKCAECRDMNRSAWSFRLRAEVQQRCLKDGWHAGFITLTYNDEHLPHIPQTCFNSYDDSSMVLDDNDQILADHFGEELHASTYTQVSCFDKEDVRFLINGMRKYLHKYFGFKGLVWILCCEYGPSTQRPHMHGLFCWPPDIPDETIYGLIRDYWRGESNVVNDDILKRMKKYRVRPDRGFVGPREFNGGTYYDKMKGIVKEEPFVCKDVAAAANYVAKYVCKDLYFQKYLGEFDLNLKSSEIKRYLCFHMQSRSLGSCVVAELTDKERLDLYLHGFGFVGEKHLFPIPVYVRNKLLFSPLYIVDKQGKRLVRRRCTEFCREHAEEIYTKKEQYYTEIFNRVCESSFFLSRFVEPEVACVFSQRNKSIVERLGAQKLARHYLCYYGVRVSQCYDVPPYLQWLNRFDYYWSSVPEHLANRAHIRNPDELIEYREAIGTVLGSLNWCAAKKHTAIEAQAELCGDYHKSI